MDVDGTTLPHVCVPSSGENVGAIGLGIHVLMTGADTRGAYSQFEYVVPPGLGGPPTHVHTREDELFVCTAGRVTVELAGRSTSCPWDRAC